MFGSQNISQIHLQDPISNTISSAGSGLLDHILGPLGFTLGRVIFTKHSTEYRGRYRAAVSANITKNSAIGNIMHIWIVNIEINIFTVLQKDLKNVLERKLLI
jgi:hypothetical protein